MHSTSVAVICGKEVETDWFWV